ncbi:MAG: hypothetical protein SNJ67_12865 [Chloracidobacterium sp.]|uniref:Type II secretory pathway, pseudopilin PulG n=1 Tax=Chloracidobacterium validum TaxID=2821543 RepID=A0ABX8B740_9BACT|nr:hypothetical protein [Chloracidobacterium validum]QUW02252.1 hypothetical protein J8C06_07745 [Chloracidobacterium validum]
MRISGYSRLRTTTARLIGWRRRRRRPERGYLLLFFIFALAAMMIVLTLTADTREAERQREREAEFIARGCAVARAIARYNNAGRIAPLNPGTPFPLKLRDLTKEVNINGLRMRLLRPSAINDPFTGREWRVVRIGDPLVRRYLERWSAFTGQPVPANYVALTASVLNQGGFGGNFDPLGGASEPGEDDDDDGFASPRPIVGVVGRLPKPAFTALFGEDVTYDEWLFMYGPIVTRPDGIVIGGTPCERPILPPP